MKLRYKITGLILSIAMLLSIFTPLTVSAEEVKEKLVKEEAPRELTLEDILAGAATVEEVYGELERASVPEIVGYETVEDMVLEQLDLLEIEQISEIYPDTYNFLMSLQDELAEMGDY